MDKTTITSHETTIAEIKKTLRASDKDTILFLEKDKKIILICCVSKKS